MGTCTHIECDVRVGSVKEVRMIWAFVAIWVVGGVLFGFMAWAGAAGFAGVLSRRSELVST